MFLSLGYFKPFLHNLELKENLLVNIKNKDNVECKNMFKWSSNLNGPVIVELLQLHYEDQIAPTLTLNKGYCWVG